MTIKDLILENGAFLCKECKQGSFNMEIKGSLEIGIKREVNEMLIDEPNFQYNFAEPTSDVLYCNNCGAEYTGAKKLFDGVVEING